MLYLAYGFTKPCTGASSSTFYNLHLVTTLERSCAVALCNVQATELVYCAFSDKYVWHIRDCVSFRVCKKEDETLRTSVVEVKIAQLFSFVKTTIRE